MSVPRDVVSGEGVPLLCVHGWGCRKEQFDEVAERLSVRFAVHRFDLPGHGETPLGDFVPTFANYARVVVEFARAHGLTEAILLGHSMGGALSLMAAAELRPRAVINLDGSLPAAARVLAAQETIRGWLDEPDVRGRLAGALREGYFLLRERDARCGRIVEEMMAMPEAVLRFLPEQIGGLRAGDYLPRITAPVLYVGAAMPRFDAEAAARLVRDFRYEQVPEAGHFLHVYAAERVAALVEGVVKGT